VLCIKPELEGRQQDWHAGQNQNTGEGVKMADVYVDDLKPHTAAATRTEQVGVHRPCDQTAQPTERQFVRQHRRL